MEKSDTLPCVCHCGKEKGTCIHTARPSAPKTRPTTASTTTAPSPVIPRTRPSTTSASSPVIPRTRPTISSAAPAIPKSTTGTTSAAPVSTRARPAPASTTSPTSGTPPTTSRAIRAPTRGGVGVQPPPAHRGPSTGAAKPAVSGGAEVPATTKQSQLPLLSMDGGHLHEYITNQHENAWSQHMAHTMARMVESGRAKVKELVARHSELEQSKTKAQGALVSVLTLTQITELKLLLDIGRKGHRFYDFVLTMLIACISLEIFVGIIIIYIGNLHYSQARRRRGFCRAFLNWCLCCCCRWSQTKRNGNYLSVRATTASGDATRSGLGLGSHLTDDDEIGTGCCDMARHYASYDTFVDLERADSNIEIAKVKVADAEVKTVRTMNYIRVVEDTLKKSPGNRDLEDELAKARAELQCSMREKEEATAEQKLAEAHQHQAFFVKEQSEDREERVVYRKGTFWQHMATYLLYFIGLMNVFITTFGISGGHGNPVMGGPRHNSTSFFT